MLILKANSLSLPLYFPPLLISSVIIYSQTFEELPVFALITTLQKVKIKVEYSIMHGQVNRYREYHLTT